MNCVMPFISSPNPDRRHSMVFEARGDNCLCQGGDLTRKAFEEIFWGDEMLNMVFWVVVTQMHANCQNSWNSEDLCILLHVKCIAI